MCEYAENIKASAFKFLAGDVIISKPGGHVWQRQPGNDLWLCLNEEYVGISPGLGSVYDSNMYVGFQMYPDRYVLMRNGVDVTPQKW